MSMKGGYKILDFGGQNILSSAEAVKIPNVWKNAETDKPILISGLIVDGEKIPDTFSSPIIKNNNKVFNLSCEIDSGTMVVVQLTITPNSYVGANVTSVGGKDYVEFDFNGYNFVDNTAGKVFPGILKALSQEKPLLCKNFKYQSKLYNFFASVKKGTAGTTGAYYIILPMDTINTDNTPVTANEYYLSVADPSETVKPIHKSISHDVSISLNNTDVTSLIDNPTTLTTLGISRTNFSNVYNYTGRTAVFTNVKSNFDTTLSRIAGQCFKYGGTSSYPDVYCTFNLPVEENEDIVLKSYVLKIYRDGVDYMVAYEQ